MPVCLEYGLSEGPLHEPHYFTGLNQLKLEFPLLDATHDSHTPEPGGELKQRDVLPRCEAMSLFVSSFFANREAPD